MSNFTKLARRALKMERAISRLLSENDTLKQRVKTLERTVDGLAERKYRPRGGETE